MALNDTAWAPNGGGGDEAARTTWLAALLKDKGVKATIVERPGYGHEWAFWRISLQDLAPRLFQPAAE